MKGKLKKGPFMIGDKRYATLTGGRMVRIIAQEDHPLWGRRYKIEDYDEWCEANCFEFIKEESDD
ncbi:MAG: hypothetical protein WC998_09405 [Candidatus Paceibacterota bacterium]|jgi:hypothetical protein